MHPHPVFPVVFLALTASLSAAPQRDEVLVVERREDVSSRNRLAATLGQIRVKITVENLDPRGLCRFLASSTEDKVNFIFVPRGLEAEDLEPITLDIDSIALLNLMGVIQEVSDMRFVYRDGMVLLTHMDEVKPLLYLEMYDLRSATMPLRNSPGVKLVLRVPGEDDLFLPPEEDDATTASGFTIDLIEDLLREHVTPDSWDTDGVSLSAANGILTIRHTFQGQQKVREALMRLGVISRPRLFMRRRPPVLPLGRSRRR